MIFQDPQAQDAAVKLLRRLDVFHKRKRVHKPQCSIRSITGPCLNAFSSVKNFATMQKRCKLGSLIHLAACVPTAAYDTNFALYRNRPDISYAYRLGRKGLFAPESNLSIFCRKTPELLQSHFPYRNDQICPANHPICKQSMVKFAVTKPACHFSVLRVYLP